MEKELYDIYKKIIIDQWIDLDASIEETNQTYEKLDKLMEPMYSFVLAYSNYYNQRRDYGKGPKLTMIEVHILTQILDMPGITVTELAKNWNRTTSAISQTIKKLMNQDLVYRENSEKNRKIFHLYATDLGNEVAIQHKRYDNIDVVKTSKKLLKEVRIDDLVSFNKVCKVYNKLLENDKN